MTLKPLKKKPLLNPKPTEATPQEEAPMTNEKKTLSPALLALLKKSGAAVASEAEIADGVISTGLLSLDHVLGGGWAKHRINELVGESGTGKTTLTYKAVAEAQAAGGIAVWVDSENSFSKELAMACGVDLDALIYRGPDYGEGLIEFALDMVESGEIALVVIDSIGALTPKKKLAADVGEANAPAQRARLVGELAERMITALAKNDTVFLATNHLTGLLKSDFHGNQIMTTKGGKTWNYLKTVSVSLKAKKTEGSEGSFHAEVEAEVLKCRRAPRGGKTSLLNVMGQGFSVMDDLIETAARLGVIEIKGAWIAFGERKFNGRAKLAEALDADADLAKLLRDTVESVL